MTVDDGDGLRAAAPCRIRFDADLPGFDRSCISPAAPTLFRSGRRNSLHFPKIRPFFLTDHAGPPLETAFNLIHHG